MERLDLGDFKLESGEVLRDAFLGYETHGELNEQADNCVLLPSYYTGTHESYIPWIGDDRLLDTSSLFVVSTDMFGSGFSTSPSNYRYGADAYPLVTIADNVRAGKALLDHLGVERVRLALGWSMGGMQVFEWAARYPELIDAMLPICATSVCKPTNTVFLSGIRSILASRGFVQARCANVAEHLQAFGRVYAGWAYSDEFFTNGVYEHLGYATIEDVLEGWAADHVAMDPNDLLAMLDTWLYAGSSVSPAPNLENIQARCILMPSTTDRYFLSEDAKAEAERIDSCGFLPLESDLGHIAGRPGIRDAETLRIAEAVTLLCGKE